MEWLKIQEKCFPVNEQCGIVLQGLLIGIEVTRHHMYSSAEKLWVVHKGRKVTVLLEGLTKVKPSITN